MLGLVLILCGRLAFHFARPLFAPLDSAARIGINLAFAWILTLAILALVRFGERLPWDSIGLRKLTRADVGWALLGFLLGGAIISATMPLVSALGLRTTEEGVRRIGELPAGWRALMVVTAACTEEIRYRGYLIERLFALTGHFALASVLSYVCFVLVHLPFWGLGGTLQIGLASMVLYALYWKRRNLFACMLMHLLNNTVAFFLIPALLPQR
jgi:membrane protease YdiL (CAAX protease family)